MTFKLHHVKHKLLEGCVKLCSCNLVIPVWQPQSLLWHFSFAVEGHRPAVSHPRFAAPLQPASLRGSASATPFWRVGH